MKRIILSTVALLAMFAFANAQVVGSHHDFSYRNSGQTYSSSSQICVFCHTPHNSFSVNVAGPLWNHNNANTDYTNTTNYGVPTSSSTYTLWSSSSSSKLGKYSTICLGCHDGQTAISDLKNPPNGVPVTMFGSKVDGTGKFLATVNENMTTDLSNDHPVGSSMSSYLNSNYSFSNAAGTKIYGGAYPGFTDSTHAAGPSNAYAGDTNNLSIGGTLTAKVYFDPSNPNAKTPTVQCMSCHDVHDKNRYPMMLRMKNDYSRLCRDCHSTK